MTGTIPGTLPRITMPIELEGGYEPTTEIDGQMGLDLLSEGPTSFASIKPTKDGVHNVVTSRLPNGMHAPVLDLDVPHTVVPSSTEGHGHLYIDVPMVWSDYKRLMKVMSEVGIIEHGFYKASVARGFSDVRLPWVTKETA